MNFNINTFDPERIIQTEFNPEMLGLTPIEFNKLKKRSEKLINFLNEKFPVTMPHFTIQNYKKEYFPYIDCLISIMNEFLFGDKKKEDFNFFPWKQEIKKRLREKYGL